MKAKCLFQNYPKILKSYMLICEIRTLWVFLHSDRTVLLFRRTERDDEDNWAV